MKGSTVILKLQPHEIKNLNISVKDAWSYAKLIISVSRLVLNRMADMTTKKVTGEYLKFCIGKFVRCYVYISSSKYISFSFPFRLSSNFLWYSSYKIDSKLISDISRIIESRNEETPLYMLYLDNGQDDAFIPDRAYEILEHILTLEPGYVRHDFDERAAKGIKHPTTHLDINFSASATFKIGTYSMFLPDKYESIFDKDDDCMFIDSYKVKDIQKHPKKFKRSTRRK